MRMAKNSLEDFQEGLTNGYEAGRSQDLIYAIGFAVGFLWGAVWGGRRVENPKLEQVGQRA